MPKNFKILKEMMMDICGYTFVSLKKKKKLSEQLGFVGESAQKRECNERKRGW